MIGQGVAGSKPRTITILHYNPKRTAKNENPPSYRFPTGSLQCSYLQLNAMWERLRCNSLLQLVFGGERYEYVTSVGLTIVEMKV